MLSDRPVSGSKNSVSQSSNTIATIKQDRIWPTSESFDRQTRSGGAFSNPTARESRKDLRNCRPPGDTPFGSMDSE
jgi:hypothetical protein